MKINIKQMHVQNSASSKYKTNKYCTYETDKREIF